MKVIDESPRMVLVESTEEELHKIVGDAQGVVIVFERHVEHPNPPLTIEKKG